MALAHVSTGIELEYETIGSPDGVPLLLVMGFTAQLTVWPDRFCEMLADAGHLVIRYDNRDCGLSTKFDGITIDTAAALAAARTGEPLPPVPYTLSEMAADAVGLLDHLGIDSAHILGASMGGMIVQTIAIEHPTRVRSLTSVMSTTGEPEFGQAAPEAMAVLLAPPPVERDAYIARSLQTQIWQSRKYHDPERTQADAARSYDRSFYPEGAQRQMAAIIATGSRAEGLRALRMPTLVIHGRDDTLILPSGGERTAELVDGAHLLLVGDMGHDLPEPLWPLLVGSVTTHTTIADGLTVAGR